MINVDHPISTFCYGDNSALDCKNILEVYKDHTRETFQTSLDRPIIQTAIDDIGRLIGAQSEAVFIHLPVQRLFSLAYLLDEMFKYEPNDEVLAKEFAAIKVVDIVEPKEETAEISFMPIFYRLKMHTNFNIAHSRKHGVHKIMLDRVPHIIEYVMYLQLCKRRYNNEFTREQRTDEFVFNAGKEFDILGSYTMHSQYVSDLGTRISAGPVTLFATEDSLAMRVFNQTFR